MNVLIVSTSYPLDEDSSSGIFVKRLVSHLPASVSPQVLVPDDNKSGRKKDSRLIRFRYAPRNLQILAHQPGGIPVALRTHKWLYGLLPLFLLSMLIHCIVLARRADLIHANWSICGMIAGIAGLLTHTPVITTLRGEDVTRAHKSWLDRNILKTCIRLNSRIIAVSDGIRIWLQTRFPQQADRFHLVENGVSDDFISIGEQRTEYNHHTLNLLTVGSLIPRKSVSTIIQALALLKPYFQPSLRIIGSGQERESLEQMSREFELDSYIEFMDHIRPCDLPAYFAWADAFILASHSEGRPNVILEAMAAGIAVIATEIDGVTELVNADTGYLFQIDDAEQLAAHIKYLHEQTSILEQLGRAGHDSILQRGLQWSTTGNKYHRHYLELGETRCAAS